MLHGKRAVVTGGSGGIGSAICRTLASEGAEVVVGYHRNEERASSVVADVQSAGGFAVGLALDVRDAVSVTKFFSRSCHALGRVDMLINCAGVATFASLAEYGEREWDWVLDTNLKGAFLCCKAVIPYFEKTGSGDIVNVSSLSASIGSFEGGAYAASKAGLNLLTRSLALELASLDIRVNAVAPGRIATSFRRTSSGEYFDFMLAQTPQKRMGTAEEVANAVAFMVSRACPFITGETLYVTGGLHTVYLDHVVPDRDSKLLWPGGEG